MSKFQRMLPIELADKDRVELASKMAEALDTKDQAEAAKQEAAKRCKDIVDEQLAEVAKIRRWLRKGEREDMVDCETVVALEENAKFVRRLDTGEEIPGSREALDTSDRQSELELVDPLTNNADEPLGDEDEAPVITEAPLPDPLAAEEGDTNDEPPA